MECLVTLGALVVLLSEWKVSKQGRCRNSFDFSGCLVSGLQEKRQLVPSSLASAAEHWLHVAFRPLV